MATQIDVPSEVAALAQRIRDAASDDHETRGLLMLAQQLLHGEFMQAQRDADEATAALVLQARAVATGVSVEDQKNAAGALLKKRPEDVSASDVLNVVLFAQAKGADAQPVDVTPQVPASP